MSTSQYELFDLMSILLKRLLGKVISVGVC